MPTPPVSTARLPLPHTPLIDHEAGFAEVRAVLLHKDAPLVALTGSGGVGETCLALQFAASFDNAFSDGVVFVPLSVLREPALVMPAVAQAVGVADSGPQLAERLAAALVTVQALLVLGNVE